MVLAAALALLDFRGDELQWRAQREVNLKKPTGWLAVAGLHWLKPGVNQIGFGTDIEIRTAEGSINWRSGDRFSATLPNGGRAADVAGFEGAVQVNEMLHSGEVIFSIIKRGSRHGLRVWDPKAPTRTNFKGLSWYPPKPDYRVKAKFVSYKTIRQLSITNILGYSEPAPNPGYFSFTLRGKRCRLEAIDEGETYFLNFKDRTSGGTTYPAGRFIDLPKRTDGKYVINFNQAYNPPCAFTNFATCPLPPTQNVLAVAIEAGEKTQHPG